MVAYFTNASLKHGLPKESKQVFYDFPLCEYLNGKVRNLGHRRSLLVQGEYLSDVFPSNLLTACKQICSSLFRLICLTFWISSLH